MPDIELPPGKYRWRRPLSLPLAWTFVGLDVVMLTWTYFNRGPEPVWFFLTVMLAFAVGLIVAGIMRNID